MFLAPTTRRALVPLALCFVALAGCGDKKHEKQVAVPADAAPKAEPPPPPEKERSFLAAACQQHGDAAKQANCLCRVDVMEAKLDGELLAKLETAPKDGPAEAVVEHMGGAANLSRVYEAMSMASQDCNEGAAQ